MVVCSTMMPVASVNALTPASLHSFSNGLCAINAIPSIQRYPPSTIVAPAPSAPMPPAITTQVMGCAQNLSPQTTPNPSPPPVNCSIIPTSTGTAVITYAPVPSNLLQINGNYQILSYSHTHQSKLPNQNSTSVSNVPCSPIYSCNPNIVPCQQRVVNGTSVLQCMPGVCQIAPTAVYPNGTVEMCPVSSPTIQSNFTLSPPSIQSNFTLSPPSIQSNFPLSPPLSMTQKLCTAAATAWKQSYGMEHVWQCEFKTLFQQYSPHVWTLLPVNQQPSGVWHANVDSAKVRFCCEDCGHGWTSMKGRVAFWFILNPASTEGVVCLKLYGQQCDRCKTGNYEPAMWYPEEVTKVLVNIYNRVGQVYYGFMQAPYHKTRRPGKPRTPHNSDLCQACKDGVCAERR